MPTSKSETPSIRYLNQRAFHLGLSIAHEGGRYRVWGDTLPHDFWDDNVIYVVKGKRELESFLDGFLLARRKDVGNY